MRKPKLPLLASRWLGLVVAFSVSVGVGLAPILGKSHVPLFSPLLNLIPASIQDSTITLSTASMGIVAACVQWIGSEKPTRTWLRRWFRLGAITCAFALVLLVLAHSFLVTRVEIFGGKKRVYFVTGFVMPKKFPCADADAAGCIKRLTFSESEIAAYWGDSQIRSAEIILELTYSAFLSAFGSIIGLVAVQLQHPVRLTRARGKKTLNE
jgi:hypothetical protein